MLFLILLDQECQRFQLVTFQRTKFGLSEFI